MAAQRNQESSKFGYHVYMSFSHKDVGRTFADHLYTALLNGGLRTYRNEDELEEDGMDHQETLEIIHGSRIGMIIFSENYCSSEHCLDELMAILESRKSTKLALLPVFYNTDPSDVRKQKGSFEDAFSRYEEREKSMTGDRKQKWIEKVKQWRHALKEVADLGGMVSQNQADGYESRFIKEIVNETGRKLSRTILDVALHPIGLDSRVKEIFSWLQDGSVDVGILAIFGMGGIGKTTIAKTAYNLSFENFDGSSFLADIRKASEHPKGLVRLQRQLLSDILGKRVEKIYNVDAGIIKIQDAVCCRKVLLVLDDVDDMDQLSSVLVMRDWFYPGSKIIVTTRNEHLLKADNTCKIFKVKAFDRKESLQLFSLHAFGNSQPPDSYRDLSKKIEHKCGGIPLALKVLGSSLCERSMEIWRSVLEKLEAIPDHEILKKLRISYDYLPDDHDQNLFLDIVCFFIGKNKQFAVTILDGCGFHSVAGIQHLIERCLITVEHDEKLKMHQLLQDMGREIIRRESPWQPGKRSRVWKHKDSYNVLKENAGTRRIEGLILDMHMLKEVKSIEGNLDRSNMHNHPKKRLKFDILGLLPKAPEMINPHTFGTDVFSMLQKLRILKLSYVHLVGFYDDFPKEVRWLQWKEFPLKAIPIDFPLESLVALDMRNSKLELVWKGTKYLGLLKILNLSHSHGLKRTPDFSELPNLTILILKDCLNLVELHDSIGNLEALVFLNLSDCINLRIFPGNFFNLKSLEKLIISGCSKLMTSVQELGKLQSLTVLHADNVPLSHPALANSQGAVWRSLLFSWLSTPGNRQNSVKSSLADLSRSLVNSSLSNCSLSDDAISVDLSSLSSLEFLNLSENPIYSLPQSIIGLSTLRDLWLDACRNLQTLPELPMSIIKLKAIQCTSLVSIMNLPNLLESLFLDVTGCEKLAEVQGLFKLEPIQNFSNELINILGNFNLDSIQDREVELYNKMTETKKRFSIQGLVEFDIFSTYLPGNEVTSCFNFAPNGGLVLSFNISCQRNTKILGLNICIVYSRCSDRKFRYWAKVGSWYSYYIRVRNVTKNLKWVYGPTFIGIPGHKEDMTFLSHWKIGDQLEVGDEVNVSVVGWSLTFQMKQLGVNFTYETQQEFSSTKLGTQDQDLIVSDPPFCSSYQTLSVDEKYMAYQVGRQAYFLSHPEYFVSKSRSEDNNSVRLVLSENLFEDAVGTAGSSNFGEGEQMEGEESDFDYDLDDDYDEDATPEEFEEMMQFSD